MDSVTQLWNTFAVAVINEKADQKERKKYKKATEKTKKQ